MAVTRCEQGHFYDSEKFAQCPHCQTAPPRRRSVGEAFTEYRPSQAAMPRKRIQITLDSASSGEEKTVGIFQQSLGCDPVVGWLVCIKGKETGRDYRLHAGRNLIGRSLRMDVCLPDEETVSREDHCSLVFEPNRRMFALARGLGEEVFVNGQRLADTLILQGGETISIGAADFVFVPFCGKERCW